MESKDVSRVDETLLYEVEADVYWCLTKLLDNIQVRGVPGWGGVCAGWKWEQPRRSYISAAGVFAAAAAAVVVVVLFLFFLLLL